jgi:hypothetical protein
MLEVRKVAAMTRFVLHPGHVPSRVDGTLHFIDAPALAALYSLPLDQCLVLDGRRPASFLGFHQEPGDVHLYPQPDGNFSLPGK